MKKNNFRYIKLKWVKSRNKLYALLRSDRSREILTFMFFLVISFIFWVLQSLNEDVESSFSLNVKYVNVPEKVVFTNKLPDEIDVRLRDKGTTLMGYLMERMPVIEIDFEQYKNNKGVFIVTSSQLSTLVRKQLKNTTTLLSVSPDSIPVYYTNNSGKKYKIRLIGSFSTVPQCVMNGEIKMSIDSATVYAPSSILKNIKEITTDSFALKSLSDTARISLNLTYIRGAKIVPEKVEVTIPIEEVTTKKLTLSVAPQNLPTGISMLTFPANVQINCMIPVSMFSKIHADDFSVGVDYNQLKDHIGKKVAVQVLKKPPFVNNVQVTPDSVEYILEEKSRVMVTIGITGGIGSGKSLISRILKIWGYPVYDTDIEAKKLMDNSDEVKNRLVALLGNIYNNTGLDRSRMASIIFNDQIKLKKVNAIVHPAVRSDFSIWVQKQNTDVAFVESAILYEAGFDKNVTFVWNVSAPLEMRVMRVMKRNNCTREEVLARISKQTSDNERNEKSNDIIYNDGIQPVIPQLRTLLAKYEK